MFSEPKFIVDFMLGRLATYLRNLGYDVKYLRLCGRDSITLQKELASESLREKRVVLTRNHKVSSKRSWKLLLIKSDDPSEQLKEVIKAFNLELSKDLIFTVCSLCGVEIKPVSKEEIKYLVPQYVYETSSFFSRCPVCKKVYWRGTHHDLFISHLRKIGLEL